MNKFKDMDIVTKMSIIGALFVLIVVIVIVSIAINGKEDNGNIISNGVNETTAAITDTNTTPEYVRTIGVVKAVDTAASSLTITDINAQETSELLITGVVDIKDAYGTPLTLAQIDVADLVDVKFDKNTMTPEYVQISAQIWERNNIDNLIIDNENSTIQLANDVYNFTEDLVTVYEGEPYNLEDLEAADEVSIKGYKDYVWSIKKLGGHGFISLDNYDKFIGGIMEIDKKTMEITYDMKITVSVGTHTITVSKDGYSSFVASVMVDEGEEVVVDIGDMESEVGIVEFVMEQEGVILDIDGEVYTEFTEPITLDYGEYTLKVELEGYQPWESTLIVNQPYMAVGVDLNTQPQYIHVDSPATCELYIDSNYIGLIPIDAPIEPGLHVITIRKDGYNVQHQNVEVLDNGQDVYFTFPDLIPLEPEVVEPVEPVEPEPVEPVEPAEPAEPAEPTEPIDDTVTTPSDDVYN